MGISEDGTSIIVRIIAVLAILILAFVINLDHILAMLNVFDLKVFQSPTGMDIQNLN